MRKEGREGEKGREGGKEGRRGKGGRAKERKGKGGREGGGRASSMSLHTLLTVPVTCEFMSHI